LIGAAPASATYPGQNGLIAFVACDDCELVPPEGIATESPDGTGFQVVVPWSESASPVEPTWSPSGQLLAYAVEASTPALNGIYVANADGSDPRQLTSGPAQNPTFSPNGKRIAFDEQGSIMSIRLDGAGSTRISQGGHSTDPVYSPDGKWIAFTRAHRSIWLMRRNGSDPHHLASGVEPDFSPDGKHVVFYAGNGTDLRTAKTDGSRVRDVVLTYVNSPDEPAYSPDGRFIVFNESSSFGIDIVKTHGSGVPLSPGPGLGYEPAWQPLIGSGR
jgi:Tol biopolymer transport system component